MKKILRIFPRLNNSRRIKDVNTHYALVSYTAAISTLHLSVAVHNTSEEILYDVKRKKFQSNGIYNFLALMLLFISSLASAQDVLVGLTSNGGSEGKGTAYSIKTNSLSFNVVKGFSDWGSFPVSDLVQGPDGNFYGMTSEGGTYNNGTIFRITSGGQLTVLKHLNMSIDGGYPTASLIAGKDGALYGTTSAGGPNNGGVVFKITTAGVYTILHSMSANTEGGHPSCHLIQGTDGNFYGTNYSGGVNYYGTVFKMSSTGSSFTVLKAFDGGKDGGSSYSSLVQGSDGAFYGMTYIGGTTSHGVIFRITSSGSYSVLHSLNGPTDGQYPLGSLIQAKDGYLYGMTYSGGANYGGTIFKINTTGTSFTVLKSLITATTGSNPHGSLLQVADGSFYGMMYYSPSGTTSTAGSVFKMTSSGSITTIKKFTLATEGGYPQGSLIQSGGVFYGMTNQGGKNDNGTIFKITTGGTITVLSHLNNDIYGTNPQENLALGADSAYYGVTQNGGLYNAGTIFKICGGVTTVLRSMKSSADGGYPTGGLVRAKDGNFYGTTELGGTNSAGTIFKISPTGAYTVLRHLNSSTDGGYPKSAMVQGADGALYGTTSTGGTGTGGTIFKITTDGSFKVLHNIVPSTDGSSPEGGLVLAKDGFFYGTTTSGARFFKISATGVFTVLHTFVYGSEGNTPVSSLSIGTDGAFYGTASYGGTYTHGTIFKISSTGTVTILHHLNGPVDGSFPKGSLVQGSDGAFYGTASAGGKYNSGTIFRIASDKSFSVLHHLNISTDGGTPLGGLILAPKNNLSVNSQSLTTSEDTSKNIVLTGSGSSSLTFNIVTSPKNGTVSGGTSANRTYTPNPNFAGKDSFAVTANIGCMISAPSWIFIKVNAVNDTPVLASIGNKSITKDATLSFTATASDVDAGQTKTFSLIDAPSGAAINATSGSFTWTPSATGSFTFRVRVTDNGSPALYDEEQITVTVTMSLAAAKGSTITTGKTEIVAFGNSSIFPNPVINDFTIKTDKSYNHVTVKIISLNGEVLYNKKFEAAGNKQLHVDGSNLKPGQYFLQLQSDQNNEVLKFIKM